MKTLFYENGVLVFLAPLTKSGYLVKDGDEQILFVNRRLSKRRQRTVIKEMQKQDDYENL